MMRYLKGIPVFLSIILLSSCSETKATEETTQIRTMDSTSRVLKKQSNKLQEQTEKVAISIEKMEEEFKSTDK